MSYINAIFDIIYAPAPRCGDSDQDSHAWVSGWYLAAPELDVLKKAYSSQQKTRNMFGVLKVFEKTRCLSKRAHSYFLYVSIPT